MVLNIPLYIYILIAIFAGMDYTSQSAINRRLKNMMKGTAYQSCLIMVLNIPL